ncbi:MAG TPA: RNA polymerase sigma factor, partial [Gemmatimonadaceae bacterium]|nr:RNA polymerase sigma factor [Gemmatimonadaceae bacterium]
MTDDDALVRATLEGNDAAFAALVDRHARVCVRYATRMLGNVQDAEDASQDAFVRAYGALARFDGSVAFRTWLMTILINRCRTLLEVRARTDARLDTLADATHAPATPPGGRDLELRDAIDRALARLDPQQREAFLLRHVEEMGY